MQSSATTLDNRGILVVWSASRAHNGQAIRGVCGQEAVDMCRRRRDCLRDFSSLELDGRAGLADGIRADVDGNVWASAGWGGDGYDGGHIFAPDGDRIGQILLPEICSNVCFGGAKRNRLFMTASQSIYAVSIETRGAHIT